MSKLIPLGLGKPLFETNFVRFQRPFSFCYSVMPPWDMVKYYTPAVLPAHRSNICNVPAGPSDHSTVLPGMFGNLHFVTEREDREFIQLLQKMPEPGSLFKILLFKSSVMLYFSSY